MNKLSNTIFLKILNDLMGGIIFKIIARLKVLASGDIFFEDKLITSMSGLESKLNEIKSLQGAVWFYRENCSNMPNEVADEVFNLVVRLKTPLSLSTKPDFSDWVDANGESHPR